MPGVVLGVRLCQIATAARCDLLRLSSCLWSDLEEYIINM